MQMELPAICDKALECYCFPSLTLLKKKKMDERSTKDKTAKFPEESIGGKLFDIEFGNGFLDAIPKTLAIKEKK